MLRRRLSSREREKLIEAKSFRCEYCPFPILAGRDRWEAVHLVALASGGADEESNLGCAHWKCHRAHTVREARILRRVKRAHQKHIGAFRSANPLPGGRDSPYRIKLDRTVERRR